MLDFFDDWVSTDKVLEISEIIFDLDSERIETFDVVEKLRLNWNLGIMAGKSNNWSLAERFILNALTINFDDFEKKPIQRHEVIRDQLRQRTLENYLEVRSYGEANLAISYLGQRKLSEAKEILDKLSSAEYDYLPEQHFITELSELIDWVNEKVDFSSYKNEFRAKLAKSSFDVFYGVRPTYKTTKFSLSETLTKVNSEKISDQIRAHIAIDHFSTLESEDLSEIHNSIESDLPNFRSLPENARNSLVAAEALRLKSKSIFDSAPAIMSYCKTFEICLKELVFKDFVNNLKNFYDLDEVVNEAKQDKKFAQFRSFINYITSGYLELGSASQCIKLSLGKTGQRVTLLKEFCTYLQYRYPNLITDDNLNTIENLSLGYRNPAVHEQNFSGDDLEYVRMRCCSLISNITSLRPISSEM